MTFVPSYLYSRQSRYYKPGGYNNFDWYRYGNDFYNWYRTEGAYDLPWLTSVPGFSTFFGMKDREKQLSDYRKNVGRAPAYVMGKNLYGSPSLRGQTYFGAKALVRSYERIFGW